MDYLESSIVPAGIRSRFIEGVNGLRMHVLEAGFETADRPCLLLLHGFPELAFSWRRVMVPLAEAGFFVVAPDQRGYGRTTGWDPHYDGNLAAFGMLNLVNDAAALLSSLGVVSVAAVVGHDFGSLVAAHAALVKPDVFRRVALMSAPYDGPPQRPATGDVKIKPDIHEALANLSPPRKHYQWYYGTRQADADMRYCRQGIEAFLRAYYHFKSADWAGNKPYPLTAWTAAELAKLPRYYVMDLDLDMAETVAAYMPSEEEVAACGWLTDAELQVYADEFSRTGFQGGLQWYRRMTESKQIEAMQPHAGRSIDVPACFIAGESDWGVYQKPGALEAMQARACKDMRSVELIPGAGHWVQQEKPAEVVRLLKRFLSLPD